MNLLSLAYLLVAQLALSEALCSPQAVLPGLKMEAVHVGRGSWDNNAIDRTPALRSKVKYVRSVSFENKSNRWYNKWWHYFDNIFGSWYAVNDLGLRFSGYFYASTSGDYTFYASNVDDGMWLYLDDDAFDCCKKTSTGKIGSPLLEVKKSSDSLEKTVHLDKGYHQFKVLYYNYRGANSLSLEYSGPGQDKTSQLPVLHEVGNSFFCPPRNTTTAVPTSSKPFPTLSIPHFTHPHATGHNHHHNQYTKAMH